MGIRIPLNLSVDSKYTIGNEYLIESTHKEYKGYYYEINGSLFAGQSFDPKAPILISVNSSKINDLLVNPETATYGAISKVNINNAIFTPIYSKGMESGIETRYFCRQINIQPITIKEIDEETYNKLQRNSLFQITFIGNGQNIEQAEKQLPGIKTWLLS